jgi:hypothetical protein
MLAALNDLEKIAGHQLPDADAFTSPRSRQDDDL